MARRNDPFGFLDPPPPVVRPCLRCLECGQEGMKVTSVTRFPDTILVNLHSALMAADVHTPRR